MKALGGSVLVAAMCMSSWASGQAPPPPTAPPPMGAPMAPPVQPLPQVAPVKTVYTGDTVINNGAMLGVGIALTAVGFVGAIVGITVAGNSERTDPCYVASCPDIDLDKRAAGLAVGFISLAFMGVGLPLIAVGARQVPEVMTPGTATLSVGPGSLRVTW